MSDSDDSSPRPAKRPKISKKDFPEKDGALWLDDGNIVLISAQGVGFRVHLSVLSMNVVGFRDMFGAVDHSDEKEKYTTRTLKDSTQDLRHFLHALYTRTYFYPGKPTHYDTLESMLRMSTKYHAKQLRHELIEHLIMIYPSEMMVLEKYKDLRIPSDDTHSLRAITMARECDVPMILPTAFYWASTISPAQLIRLQPKLKSKDLAEILVGREKIAQAVYKAMWCWLSETRHGCKGDRKCRARRLSVLRDTNQFQGAPPSFFLNKILPETPDEESSDSESDEEDEEGKFCEHCLQQWYTPKKMRKDYQDIWDSLPSYFTLPSWDDLDDMKY
ncbi:uncharacterized protein BT62DRAFT_934292 [Guyanagaster necrorhizus]|uniref:BTB domain-containing protein n=1 Tax=Guyanagaster necrorhizus TaxID=856835 RepID=A0A9P7VPJ0_9AGAR|nr:uncharacterized protein BT62DRAFT_934292 [Guyanagaster necrorhizus MCA 3950]KAG7444120.1 hypothetical protein BT62DRAFT_934292 [Guyanagaster necrorhizus MCA 3950]